MNILFVNRFYWPEESGTGKVLQELAEDLVASGHSVSVVCSSSLIHDPLRRLPSFESHGDVSVYRVPSGRFNRTSVVGWFLNAVMFYPFAVLRILLLPSHTCTVFMTDPPLLFCLGPLVRFLKGSSFVCWSQDLYPDVAISLGVLSSRSLLTSWWVSVAKWALVRADLVIAIGDRMQDLLLGKGVLPSRIAVCQNWADGARVFPVEPSSNPFLALHDLSGKFVVMYSGNFGLSHEFETLLAAGRELYPSADVVFVFVGSGKQFAQVKASTSGVRALFLPFQPEAELSASLSAASVHVVSLKDGLSGVLVPSKIYGCMAVARPVIYVGPPDSEAASIVSSSACGFVVGLGDVRGLVSAVLRLRAAPEEGRLMGQRGLAVFNASYERTVSTTRIRWALEGIPSAG